MDKSRRYPRTSIRLEVNNIVACGDFGEIISGKLYTDSCTIDTNVHVISDDMDNKTQVFFLQEFQNLIKVMSHDKFIYFLGISASPDCFYLLFEKSDISVSLKQVLLNNRKKVILHEVQILQIVYDLSLAMEYLEFNQICHNSLTSHNIFIKPNNQVKIQLIGPIMFIPPEGRPIDISRWKAPEVLKFQNVSIKSNIWSFAVVAWECCTLGATPYANITTQDLLPRIRNGLRPEQSKCIFNDIYQLFINCWQLEPSDRISFAEINISIKQMLTSPKHIINTSITGDFHLPYYLPLLEIQN